MKSIKLNSRSIKKYDGILICTDHDKVDYDLIYKNSSIILMKNVKAIITDVKQNQIVITSLSAKYNSGNSETNFIDNVFLAFADNTIKSENLDLLFEENLLYISNEIVYKNSNIMLEADKLELEILSKDIKIYMHDKNQKIQISGTY